MRENGVRTKRAIEALRSGVPNRDAVRELGSSHTAIEATFLSRLGITTQGEPAGGLVVSGDFGSGKSHLLEYLQHVALENNHVASKVVISKETPLHDLGKVFRTAVHSARLPDRQGAALDEIADTLSARRDTPEYRAFSAWVHDPACGINDRFAAALYLYDQTRGDRALHDRIVRFWAGDKLNVSELRKELKAIGESATYTFPKVTEKQLALQRFLFASRLIRAAGYAGWVLLLDEIELIGRYSLLQRAQAYAEVARWIDAHEPAVIPGVATVLTVSQDFFSEVIEYRGDLDQAPNRLRVRGKPGDDDLARRAEIGMRQLSRESTLLLDPPDLTVLTQTYVRLRELHAVAYDWTPPELPVEQLDGSLPMRQYVRRWIYEWDLRRLHPGHRPEIEVGRVATDFREDEALTSAENDGVDREMH